MAGGAPAGNGPAAGGPARGLSAAELAAALAELAPRLTGARLLDAVPLRLLPQQDDLLLVFDGPAAAPGKCFVHLAPGGSRARLAPTARRFAKAQQAQGPPRDALARELAEARLTGLEQPPGERRLLLHFATPRGARSLAVELFGARGLWALCDEAQRVLWLSREVVTAVRTLRPGEPYAPPPAAEPAPAPAAAPPPRFAAPVLAAIDAHFTALDLAAEHELEAAALRRAAERARHKLQAKLDGLRQQLADTGRLDQLREQASLLLAYAHTAARGAAWLDVPDVDGQGPRRLPLDPARPVVAQAQALFEKARRLAEGRAIATARLATAEAQQRDLDAVMAGLAALPAEPTARGAALAPLRAALQRLGVALPAPAAGPAPAAKPRPVEAPSPDFRRFVSAEGYPILVGKHNEGNDRLTLRIANGNDLWLHVGGGRAGSHVVVRLPKQKTASLETLLDAATLAVHFSKARGQGRVEVVYTQKKHVRKPKGLPAGAVVPSHTKTIAVHADPARLQRLLGGAGGDAE